MDGPERLAKITVKQLLQEFPGGLGMFTPDGFVLAMSPHGDREAGRRPGQIDGMHVTEVDPGALGDEVMTRIAEVCATGEISALHLVPWATGDGLAQLWRNVFFPILDDDGAVAAVGVEFTDIAGQERTADRLRSFEQVVEQTSNAVGMMTLDNHLLYLNPAGRQLVGHAEHEPLLGGIDAYLDGPVPGEWVTGEESWRGALVLRRADDGVRVAVEGVVFTVRSDEGRPLFRALVLRDVRDRDRLLRRLELQMARMPVPVVTVDRDAVVQRWNPAAEALFGHSASAAAGQPVDRLLGAPQLRDLCAAPAGAPPQLIAAVSASGAELAVEWSAVPLEDVADGAEATMLIGRDLTSRLRAEEERRRSAVRMRELELERRRLLERMLLTEEEERGRIAGALHDDTVQLMAALQINLDRIGVALGGEAPVATSLLAETRTALTEALDRTRHLMFELRPQQFDRHGLRYAITALCEQVGLETGMIVSVDVSTQRFEPLIEELCYRTVREAVVNARKHSAARHLAVSLHEAAGAVEGTISDDGSGFDFEQLSRRRLQLHMGLDAMAERLRMADGHCDVQSAPGEGCTVTFSIPLPDRRGDVP